MKTPSKKLTVIISAVFCLVLILAVFIIMVLTGKIDLFGKNETNGIAVTPSYLYTSVTDVDVLDGNIYAADKTGRKVYRLSADGKISVTYSAGTQVNGVYAANDAVYALVGAADGKVIVLDSEFKNVAEIPVGHTPSAMVISGGKAYVANRFDNNISVIDLSSKNETAVIGIDGREAVDMALAGEKLYVACHLPEDSSTDSVISANVAVISTATDELVNTIELVNGAGGVKGIAASPDGKSVYVTHLVARYGYPTTQLDRGWINTNGFSVINTDDDTALAMLLDEVELGAANPWGVDVSGDGKQVIFTISGTDEAMIVDVEKMNNKIDAVKNGNGVVESTDKIVDYLPFLDDCRTRISLSGKGARAVTVDGNTAYIGQYFTGDIETVDLATAAVSNIHFVDQPENDMVRKGEILFADANKCYQKWESCLSCHPDALADGLNWDNINDGLGNPKSARSMLYSHRTPPTMSTGIRASAEIAVRAGMKYIQFNVLPEEDLICIDEYLKSLQPEQSPYLNTDGTLTESALRGKELFESEGCASCHPAPLYTDLKLHATKATEDTVSWENREMDTPTLVEVWRTGPWCFDGRFSTMEEAVRFYADNDALTEQDITDLANFVLSIGDEGEQYGVEQVFVTADGTEASGKLTAGGEITSFTVRRQQEDSEKTAVVTATLTDADGKKIKSEEIKLEDMQFNTAVSISLKEFKIPESGAKLTITIQNSKGDDISSPYVLVQ